MKKSNTIAIEITDTHVKVLEAKEQHGTFLISRCSIQELGESSDDAIAQVLSKTIKKEKKQGLKECILVIPRRLAILKQVSFPSQSHDEIHRMLALQISNLVPYSREDIIFDLARLYKDESGYTKILLVAVHRNIVNRYVNILNKAGFVPTKTFVSSFGVLEWVSNKNLETTAQQEPVAFIHIDYSHSEICFCHNKKLLFSRYINFGAKDLKQHLPGFAEQVGLTFGAYKKDGMGTDITKIVILSSMPDIGDMIKESLQAYYHVPIDILLVSQKNFAEKDFDFSSLRESEGFSALSLAGFFASNLMQMINLMPTDLENKQKWMAQKQKIIQFSSLIILTVLLGFGALYINNYEYVRQLNVLKKKLSDTKQAVALAQKENKFVHFIRGEIQNRVFIADIIKELYSLTPQEITFQSLSFNNKQGITLQGIADTGSKVNQFQGLLVKSPLFKNVTLQYATRRKRFKEEYTDFKITFQLSTHAQLINQ